MTQCPRQLQPMCPKWDREFDERRAVQIEWLAKAELDNLASEFEIFIIVISAVAVHVVIKFLDHWNVNFGVFLIEIV